MPSNPDPRGGSRSRGPRYQLPRTPRNFTYISSLVKYSLFFFNFLFWILGALMMAIGTWAAIDKWASGESFRLENIFDVLFNLAFLLIIIGGVIFIVSFAGCIGALRENMCLLKFYSICLLVFFLIEMGLAALGFIFPHKLSDFLEGTLSEELIRNYRDDLDLQNLIDLVQKEFQCCGLSSEGYRDWTKNEYFNCSSPSVERCGVPFSCCISESSHNEEPGLVNIMCGFQLQLLNDVATKIYTQGCIPSIRTYVEGNLYAIGGIATGVAIIQLIVIWLGRTLEGQIENQRSLWQ